MPVWHAKTREARADGALELVGLALEQHPERCALYAQWQGFDWPIVWDPFDLAELQVVPVSVAIDEAGLVRRIGLTPDELEDFLLAEWDDEEPPPQALPQALIVPVRRAHVGPPELAQDATLTPDEALARLLWQEQANGRALTAHDYERSLAALERAAAADSSPTATFRLGVALRLRHDSPHAVAGDFQASIDHWSTALAADPAQYIWRRRIQQWGPLLDKPYPFYDWVEEARAALLTRGETPVALAVPLTRSEIAGPGAAREAALPERRHPDPERRLPREPGSWIALETAVAPHTGERGASDRSSAQVHLLLTPSRARDVHWSNDAGPTVVWIDDAAALGLAAPFVELPLDSRLPETSQETRQADFTVRASTPGRTITGTVFSYLCEGGSGECRFLAQDFELALPAGE